VAALHLTDPIVLALPRGGVPVAAEVAARLHAPLDVYVARKVGMPGRPEAGIGAVAEDGLAVIGLDLDGAVANAWPALVVDVRDEIERRVRLYRGGRPLPQLRGAEVVLVDDGLATGVTAEAALRALRAHEPCRLVLAVPACAADTADRLAPLVDDIVCVHRSNNFAAVGLWYRDFRQTTDDEVLQTLAGAEPSSETCP
jgi:putative phosphoribosyl transferase